MVVMKVKEWISRRSTAGERDEGNEDGGGPRIRVRCGVEIL